MQAASKVFGDGMSRPWLRWLIVTMVLAIIAFLASPNGPLGSFWRPSVEVPIPTDAQLPLLILLNIAEATMFGLGVSFQIFGYPLVRTALPSPRGLTIAAYLSIGWLLASWWPHDSLHIADGLNLNGLIAIEYGFHVTLMVSGVILAVFYALQHQQPVRS